MFWAGRFRDQLNTGFFRVLLNQHNPKQGNTKIPPGRRWKSSSEALFYQRCNRYVCAYARAKKRNTLIRVYHVQCRALA